MKSLYLLLLLLACCIAGSTASVYLSTEGVDSLDCGSSENPCLTLQYAISAFSEAGEQFLLAPGGYDISSPDGIVINNKIAIQGLEQEDATVLLSCTNGNSPCFHVDAQGVTFSTVHVASFGSSPVFVIGGTVASASLRLHSCDITDGGEKGEASEPLLSFGTLADEDADLLIESCTFSSLSAPMVAAGQSSIEITGTSVTDVAYDTITPLIKTSGPLTLQNSDFFDITLEDSVVLVSGSLFVQSCSFHEIEAENVISKRLDSSGIVSQSKFDSNAAVSVRFSISEEPGTISGDHVIEKSEFYRNSMTPVRVSTDKVTSVMVSHCDFVENTGEEAGAISFAAYGSDSVTDQVDSAVMVVQNCTVADNTWSDDNVGDDEDISGAIDCTSMYLPAEISFEDQSSNRVYGNEPANLVTRSCTLSCDNDSQEYCHLDDPVPVGLILLGSAVLLLLIILSVTICSVIMGVRLCRYLNGHHEPDMDDEFLNKY